MTDPRHKQLDDLLAAAWSAWNEENRSKNHDEAIKLVRQFLAEVEPAPRPQKTPGVTSTSRALVCRTNPGVRFASVTVAARFLGASSSNAIYEALNAGRPVRGVHLRFEDTPESECQPIRELVPRGRPPKVSPAEAVPA